MNTTDQFLDELSQLLAKYNATIRFDCHDCSDTHGLVGDQLVIDRIIDGKDTTVLNTQSWHLDVHSIKNSR